MISSINVVAFVDHRSLRGGTGTIRKSNGVHPDDLINAVVVARITPGGIRSVSQTLIQRVGIEKVVLVV